MNCDLENAAWILTVDHVFDPALDDADGTGVDDVGTRSFNYRKALDLAHRFRCLDDDGHVDYEGKCSCNSSFAPLDDFCLPNAGSTSIQYFENGAWETL